MCIMCMPNGALEPHYNTRVLQAAKNKDKARFRFTEVPFYELLDDNPSRVRVAYFDENMDKSYLDKLGFFHELYRNS